jgi:hypothetical protein
VGRRRGGAGGLKAGPREISRRQVASGGGGAVGGGAGPRQSAAAETSPPEILNPGTCGADCAHVGLKAVGLLAPM